MQVADIKQIWLSQPSPNFTSSLGNQWQSTGFPANPTFIKQSATSYLDITCEGDFLAGNQDDAVGIGLYMNGSLWAASFNHTSKSGSIDTLSIGQGPIPNKAAGSYTVDLRFWALNNSHPVLLLSNALSLKIVEYDLADIAAGSSPDLSDVYARLDAIESKLSSASLALA